MTARNVTGNLARVSSKPWTDSRSGQDITLYSFQLEGSPQWFRTGTNPINAGVGQSVKFVADAEKVDMGTFQVVQSQVAQAPIVPDPVVNASVSQNAPARNPYPARRAQSTGAKDDYWATKEARDVEKDARFQAVSEPRMALSVAVSAASSLVQAAISKDALSFGNSTKAKRVGILAAYVKELALELAVFIQEAPTNLANYKADTKVAASGNSAQAESEVAE